LKLSGPKTRNQDRDLVYLLQLAKKHDLAPDSLHDSLLAARRRGRVQCGPLHIQTRSRGPVSSIYMFSTNGNSLAQASLRDDSIRKLKRLPDELLSYLEADEKKADSNRIGLPSEIGKLRFGLRGVSFKARVVKKSEVRAVTSKDGTPLLVCDVTLSDGTGEIPLAVWNGQIATVSEGDVVQIENANVRSFRGEIQLSLSRKTGALTVLPS